jgi:hypothetical protein
MELGLKTEGPASLYHAVEGLYERLAPIFKKNLV